MKHFVTIFTEAQNVHLVKDNGQIPYQMQRHFGYNSTLVTYKNSDDYPYLNDEVAGLNIEFIKDEGSTLFWENAVVKYLWEHARSIDVLNLYYLSQANMLYATIYKYQNPEGVLYLKMDMDVNKYCREGIKFSKSKWKDFIHKKYFNRFLKKVDIVSAESRQGLDIISELSKKLFDKTIIVSNGIDPEKREDFYTDDFFAKKENIILTVGRIGTEQKNNELLLKVLSTMNLGTWKVIFVGPIAESFQPVISTFFRKNPEKKGKVHFIGAVFDRQKLWSYYARAKLFCLTSNWEGFPLVFGEAQSAGNYIISTDISSINEVTQYGKWGDVITLDDPEELRAALKRCMNESFYTKSLMNDIIDYADRYHWPVILEELNSELTKKLARNNTECIPAIT